MLSLQFITSGLPIPDKEPYKSTMIQQFIPMVTFHPEQAIVVFAVIFVTCLMMIPRFERMKQNEKLTGEDNV
jgi:hypothetical protein